MLWKSTYTDVDLESKVKSNMLKEYPPFLHAWHVANVNMTVLCYASYGVLERDPHTNLSIYPKNVFDTGFKSIVDIIYKLLM